MARIVGRKSTPVVCSRCKWKGRRKRWILTKPCPACDGRVEKRDHQSK